LPPGLTSLTTLYLAGNRLTSLTLSAGLTNLTGLDLDGNQLTSFTLPPGLTNLTWLSLLNNHLTNFSFLSGLTSLTTLDLSYNQLTNFTLPPGLTSLTTLDLSYNHLTSLTLLTGLTNLTTLYLSGNPLTTLVLPEPLAFRAAGWVANSQIQGASVYTYPLAVSLVSPHPNLFAGFGFGLTGPPAVYTILSSTDLAAWNQVGTLTNTVGAVVFTDAQATNSVHRFYRAVSR
jgi:hypothetical protein